MSSALGAVDWIHDSILDRNRRLRRQEEIDSTLESSRGSINLRHIWAQSRKILGYSQSWLIITLVGAHISHRRGSFDQA